MERPRVTKYERHSEAASLQWNENKKYFPLDLKKQNEIG